MHYELGEGGLVIPFGAMLEHGDFTELKGKSLLVNLKTVARNIVSAYDFDLGGQADFELTAKAMLQETIATLAAELQQRHGIRVALYNIDYAKVLKCRTAALWQPTTEKQKLLQSRNEFLWNELDQYATLSFGNREVTCPSQLSSETVGIITHYAHDLLHHHTFRSLKLLESHTGAIKDPTKFNSKLNLDKDKRRVVSFNRFNQRVFGDGTLYAAQPLGVRRALLALYDKLGINPTTKLERLKFQIENKNAALYMGLRDLFR